MIPPRLALVGFALLIHQIYPAHMSLLFFLQTCNGQIFVKRHFVFGAVIKIVGMCVPKQIITKNEMKPTGCMNLCE